MAESPVVGAVWSDFRRSFANTLAEKSKPMFIWGTPDPGDVLVYKEVLRGGLCAGWEPIRFHHILNRGEVVTSVIGLTNKSSRTGSARISTIEGGPGTGHVLLEVVPPWFRQFQITVYVFGHEERNLRLQSIACRANSCDVINSLTASLENFHVKDEPLEIANHRIRDHDLDFLKFIPSREDILRLSERASSISKAGSDENPDYMASDAYPSEKTPYPASKESAHVHHHQPLPPPRFHKHPVSPGKSTPPNVGTMSFVCMDSERSSDTCCVSNFDIRQPLPYGEDDSCSASSLPNDSSTTESIKADVIENAVVRIDPKYWKGSLKGKIVPPDKARDGPRQEVFPGCFGCSLLSNANAKVLQGVTELDDSASTGVLEEQEKLETDASYSEVPTEALDSFRPTDDAHGRITPLPINAHLIRPKSEPFDRTITEFVPLIYDASRKMRASETIITVCKTTSNTNRNKTKMSLLQFAETIKLAQQLREPARQDNTNQLASSQEPQHQKRRTRSVSASRDVNGDWIKEPTDIQERGKPDRVKHAKLQGLPSTDENSKLRSIEPHRAKPTVHLTGPHGTELPSYFSTRASQEKGSCSQTPSTGGSVNTTSCTRSGETANTSEVRVKFANHDLESESDALQGLSATGNINCIQMMTSSTAQAVECMLKKTLPCEQHTLCKDFVGTANRNSNVPDHFVCSDVEGYFNPALYLNESCAFESSLERENVWPDRQGVVGSYWDPALSKTFQYEPSNAPHRIRFSGDSGPNMSRSRKKASSREKRMSCEIGRSCGGRRSDIDPSSSSELGSTEQIKLAQIHSESGSSAAEKSFESSHLDRALRMIIGDPKEALLAEKYAGEAEDGSSTSAYSGMFESEERGQNDNDFRGDTPYRDYVCTSASQDEQLPVAKSQSSLPFIVKNHACLPEDGGENELEPAESAIAADGVTNAPNKLEKKESSRVMSAAMESSNIAANTARTRARRTFHDPALVQAVLESRTGGPGSMQDPNFRSLTSIAYSGCVSGVPQDGLIEDPERRSLCCKGSDGVVPGKMKSAFCSRSRRLFQTAPLHRESTKKLRRPTPSIRTVDTNSSLEKDSDLFALSNAQLNQAVGLRTGQQSDDEATTGTRSRPSRE